MIQPITIYQTTDGSRFEEYSEAAAYEKIFERCYKIMSVLRPREPDGAVRQDKYKIRDAFNKLMELCSELIPQFKHTFDGVASGKTHPSWAERVLSEYSSTYKCLWKAFFRFECMNRESGIEYEQPYYVAHENEWKGEVV